MAQRIQQVLPTGQAPTASISPGAFDAEFAAAGNLGAQISQFGGQLGDQAVRIGKLQEASEVRNASVDYDAALLQQKIELDQDIDFASHGQKITDWHDKWWSERMKGVKNNNARDRLDLLSKKTRTLAIGDTVFSASRKLTKQTLALLDFQLEAAAEKEATAPTPIRQRDARIEWEGYLDELVATKAITPTGAKIARFEYADSLQTKREDILEEMKIEDFVAAREQAMTFGTVKEATTFIDSLTGEFDRTERNDLIAQVKRKFGYRAAQATEALENKRKADRQAIVDKFIATDFTNIEAEINRTDLLPREKLNWIEKADVRAKAIAAGKVDPFEVTTPSVYFEIRRRIAQGDEEITEEFLASYVGIPKEIKTDTGITIKGTISGVKGGAYETLLGMITKEEEKPEKLKNPLNRSSARRAQQVIDRIRTRTLQGIAAGAKGFEDLDPETIDFNSLRVQNELDAWIVANPDATDADIEKKAQALIRPAVEEITLGWFEQMFSSGPQLVEKLTKKKLEALEGQAAFGRLSTAEQNKAISLVESGLTVEEAFLEIEEPTATRGGFGVRADGTEKGKGFFGELQLPDGNVTTEFSIGIEIDGKETQIPLLVPTLTKTELDLMINDIIPNKKPIPNKIAVRAISHAKMRIADGKNPFAGEGEQAITATNPTTGEKIISFDGGKSWQSR